MSLKLLISFIAFFCIQHVVYAQKDTVVFKGYPVIAHSDTLFHIKNKLGSLSASERAQRTSTKVEALSEDLLFIADSLVTENDSTLIGIAYKGDILISLSKADADSVNMDKEVMAKAYQEIIINNINNYRKETNVSELLKRAGLGFLIILVLGVCIFFLNKYSNRFNSWLSFKLHKKIGHIKIKDYELIDRKRERILISKLLNLIKIL